MLLQGLIGWWMVKSGLEMDPEQRREIRVSPYRLATHLGMAFTTYSLLVWTGGSVRQQPPALAAANKQGRRATHSSLSRFVVPGGRATGGGAVWG